MPYFQLILNVLVKNPQLTTTTSVLWMPLLFCHIPCLGNSSPYLEHRSQALLFRTLCRPSLSLCGLLCDQCVCFRRLLSSCPGDPEPVTAWAVWSSSMPQCPQCPQCPPMPPMAPMPPMPPMPRMPSMPSMPRMPSMPPMPSMFLAGSLGPWRCEA